MTGKAGWVGTDIRRAAGRFAVLALIWVVLAGGNLRGWFVAIPAVGLACYLSIALRPLSSPGVHLSGAARFVPYFLWASLRGGIDVARRAYRFPPAVDPGLIHFRPRLTGSASTMFFATVIGLFPGTLGVARTGDTLRIHLLDRSALDEPELRRLERHVGRMFGEGESIRS